MSIEPVKIEGLREFGTRLKKVDKELPKGIRLALNAASEIVVDQARPKVPTRSGKAARSIRPRSTRTKARVSAGGRRAPYYPWLDFGGKVGRSRSISRPFKRDGRYIYPAYRRLKGSGEFQDLMTAELVKLARKAGLDVTQS